MQLLIISILFQHRSLLFQYYLDPHLNGGLLAEKDIRTYQRRVTTCKHRRDCYRQIYGEVCIHPDLASKHNSIKL